MAEHTQSNESLRCTDNRLSIGLGSVDTDTPAVNAKSAFGKELYGAGIDFVFLHKDSGGKCFGCVIVERSTRRLG